MSLTEDKESLFVGKKYVYYQRKWAQLRQNPTAFSFNVAAFLFGVLWMAYRKMYLYAWIFIAILFIETLVEIIFDVSDKLSNAITIGFYVVCGTQSNTLYKYHVEKKIKEITATVPPEQLDAELIKRGGTSVWAAIGYFVILIALLVLGFFAMDALGFVELN